MTQSDQARTSPQAGRLATVALPGEIDLINVGQVRDALALALESGAAVVIADATKTTFCDCAGARALVRAHRQAAASARRLRVAAGGGGVRRVLALTGADRILDIYPTLAAAAGPSRERDTVLPGRPRRARRAGDAGA